MKFWSLLLCLFWVASAAASTASPTDPSAKGNAPFLDQSFAAPSDRIDPASVFALDGPMKQYLNTNIAATLRDRGRQQGLFESLYSKGELKLDYDAAVTRNASEAFAAKSGNCLSLVILTAAFAKELHIPVRYQQVYVEEAWSRSEETNYFDEHVNVTLGEKAIVGRMRYIDQRELTIDFLPPQDLGNRRTRVLAESTIVAMYMNNRAAENLAKSQLDNAYWWAKASIGQDPHYLPAYNTLGVIYLRHGNLPEAEQIFSYILAIEHENTIAMSNKVLVLNALGRTAEAADLAETLKKIRPYPPFHFYDLGMVAMKQGDWAKAKEMFAKEIEREAYFDKSHFWLGVAYYQLGDIRNARRQMAIAMETSTTTSEYQLYAAKLAKLRSERLD